MAETLGVKPLNAIYEEGQLVICSIVSVDKAENDFYKVTATFNPSYINNNININKRHLVMAAVKSIEDHGYIMDVGKSSLKAFLSMKKAGNQKVMQGSFFSNRGLFLNPGNGVVKT